MSSIIICGSLVNAHHVYHRSSARGAGEGLAGVLAVGISVSGSSIGEKLPFSASIDNIFF